MSVTINGTDGSVSVPAMQGSTAGTSTGLYFPATNQAAIATNGVQAVLVDEDRSVRINGASAATIDSKLNTQVTSAGSLITLAEFRNLDYTTGTKSFVRVRNAINAGSSYSSYFGQGSDGRTYIVSNNSARGGDLIINGDNGAVTTPNQPMFSVFKDNGNVAGASGSGAQIIFNQTLVNVGSSYNTGNGYFTAPVAGTYYFSALGMVSTVGGVHDIQLRIQVNGTDIAISNPPAPSATTQGMGFATSAIITLAASDSVRCTFYATASSTTFYATGGRFNNFSGFLVG